MAENFGNNYVTTLAADVSDTDTTLTVGAAPVGLSPNFRIIIDQELMLVTGVSGATFTVTRGIEGTTAVAHTAAAPVSHVLTAGGLIQAISEGGRYPVQDYTGAYDDGFNGTSFDPKWLAGDAASASFPPDGTANVTFGTYKGRYMQSLAGAPSDFTVRTLIRNLSAKGGMTGILIADASGNGVGFSAYDNPDSTFMWTVTAYGYASTGPQGNGPVAVEAVWLELEKVGTSYRGRWTPDPAGEVNWSAWTSTLTSSATMTQIGVCRMYTNGGSIIFRWDAFVLEAI